MAIYPEEMHESSADIEDVMSKCIGLSVKLYA